MIQISFDDLMMKIGRPVLERPSLAPTEPTYVRCLFDWRVDYCNREFVNTYAVRSGKSVVDVFARRPSLEERLRSFLLSNKSLAIVTGPSGFGKTTLGIRFYKTWKEHDSTKVLLVRSTALPETGDIEQHIAEQLGGLGARGPFSLFQFERWLKENDLRFVLFLDGINEFSPNLARCVQLLRIVLRFCYFLPEEDSALRVIATIRQETWNAMLPHLDVAQLHKALWNESAALSVNTIACGPFTDEELEDALTRLRDFGYAAIDKSILSAFVINQLRDPFLLSVVADTARQGISAIPTAGVYQRAFEAKLRQRGSFVDTATLKDILASVALKCLNRQQDRFREVDIEPAQLRGEVIRIMKDLQVFIDAVDGFLQFNHDRTLEYFLALGLASAAGPTLETLDNLRDFLRNFKGQNKPLAAARLFFQLAPQQRFSLISSGLRLLDSRDSRYGSSDRELIFDFGREVLAEMAEQGDPVAEQYLADGIAAARLGSIGDHQIRALVQSAALLPDRSISLLTQLEQCPSSLARTEANIYATDKLVKEFLASGCPTIDLFVDQPYSIFFSDSSLSPRQKLARLLGFAAQLGPDNTHPDEYAAVERTLQSAVDRLFHERLWTPDETVAFVEFFLANSDRLMFNATPQGIMRFFGNPKRKELRVVFERLAAGGVLTDQDFGVFEPYTQTLSADVEYHLSHVFFVLSSLNDLEATLRLAETRFASFSNNTAPEEIDFFQAILVYLHVLHGIAYNEQRFRKWEEMILRDWPDVLLFRPGIERGERRGFQDSFDRFFEDGFGVLYPYGVLRPSLRRRQLRYSDYRRELATETSSPLPLYTRYLEEFLGANRVEEALQILQALSGVIVVWPAEGLLALRDVIGYPEARVRRATVRILAEAFNRHPDETMQFVNTSGSAISDEDLLEIRIRQDARIGRRQIEAEEWARIGRFLLGLPGSRSALVACIDGLLRSDSLADGISNIVQTLGLVASRR